MKKHYLDDFYRSKNPLWDTDARNILDWNSEIKTFPKPNNYKWDKFFEVIGKAFTAFLIGFLLAFIISLI